MKSLSKAMSFLVLALVSSVSIAALPMEATQAFTDIGTAVTDVMAAVWPIAGAVIVAFLTLKLVKRGASKAT